MTKYLKSFLVLLSITGGTLGSAQDLKPYKKDNRWGFLRNDEPFILPQYDSVLDFSDDRAAVLLNGKWGYIDQSGKLVVKMQYDIAEVHVRETADIFYDMPGMARVSIKGKWGFNGIYQGEGVPVIYEEVAFFSEGLSVMRLNGKYGYVNREGKVVIKPIYDAAASFFEGKAEVKLKGRTFSINQQGKEVTTK